jgi:Arylsulfotransferase (ASST)
MATIMATQLAGASETFNFTFQHDARFSDNGITLWNNALKEGGFSSASVASAMQVAVDEVNSVAMLIWQGTAPSFGRSESQGNHQLLPNGNHFCGMGSTPEIFELTPGGTVAFDGWFGTEPIRSGPRQYYPTQSYRAFRSEWVGHPKMTELAMFAFTRNCSAPTAFHVSWNGATEVSKYRFYASNSSAGPFQLTATANKNLEFETSTFGSSFTLYSYASAFGLYDQFLGRTPLVKTFVPVGGLAASCTDAACSGDTDYESEQQEQCIIEGVTADRSTERPSAQLMVNQR